MGKTAMATAVQQSVLAVEFSSDEEEEIVDEPPPPLEPSLPSEVWVRELVLLQQQLNIEQAARKSEQQQMRDSEQRLREEFTTISEQVARQRALDKKQWHARAARLLAEQAALLIRQIDCCPVEEEDTRDKLQQVQAAVEPLLSQAEEHGGAMTADEQADLALAEAEYDEKNAIVWARRFERRAKDAEARVKRLEEELKEAG